MSLYVIPAVSKPAQKMESEYLQPRYLSSAQGTNDQESETVDVEVLMEGLARYELVGVPINIEFGVDWFAFSGSIVS